MTEEEDIEIIKEMQTSLRVRKFIDSLKYPLLGSWLVSMYISWLDSNNVNGFIVAFSIFSFIAIIACGTSIWGFWYTSRTMIKKKK